MINPMEKIEISHRTIIFTILFILGLVLLYHIRDIIVFLFVSLVFTTALGPIVNKLEKLKIPRFLAVLIVYLLIAGGLVAVVVFSVPLLAKQTTALFKGLPDFLEQIGMANLDIQLSDYSEQLAKIPANIIKIIASAFSNLIKVFAFLVVTYYLLMERKDLKKHLHFLFADDGELKAEKFILELEKRLGGWVRGELVLMVVIGLMSYFGLRLLDLDFALPLALIAGILEIVPNIGPTLAMIPAAIVGFGSSSLMGAAVIALYFLIQQIENNFIVPKVMEKAVGLHPLVTLVSLMIGFRLGGVGGSLLAVPLVLFLKVLFERFILPTRKA